MRIVCLSLLLLAVLAPPAGATGQTPERLLLNGRVLALYATPLAPLLHDREDLEKVFESWSTGCWRGYVGTWHIEGDRLLLVSLGRDAGDSEDGEDPVWGGPVLEGIPLSTVFGDVEGPIPATWFSGTLRLPMSPSYRYVHMGFGTTFDEELHLELVRGRVVARRLVDMRVETRGRCEDDLTWVALASVAHAAAPVNDDGKWADARGIATASFREAVAGEKPFLTRGIVNREGDAGPVVLRIPETAVTPEVRLPVARGPTWPGEDTWAHVELEATWTVKDGTSALGVRWYRRLRTGETIHHPEYPLPDLPPGWTRPGADPEHLSHMRDPEDLDYFATCNESFTAVHGILEGEDPAQVLGADVARAPELTGKRVVAVGMLTKWPISKRLLDLRHPEVEPLRSRGPGIYYRLLDPKTRRLAQPRAANTEEDD